MSFRLVTYWAGAAYERWARSLAMSAGAVGVPITVYEATDWSDWQKNTLMKPHFIRRALEEFPDDDVVWVDADCTVHQYPKRFDELAHAKVALYIDMADTGSLGINGSVSFFRNRPDVRQVLDMWEVMNKGFPNDADDANLWRCFGNGVLGMRGVEALDPAYCWKEQIMRKRYPTVKPVIEMHMVHHFGLDNE